MNLSISEMLMYLCYKDKHLYKQIHHYKYSCTIGLEKLLFNFMAEIKTKTITI